MPEPEEGRLGETRFFKMLSPGTMISHYKIIEKIGEGGMGVVYKALDTKLDRKVALKFLPPRLLCDDEARERFEHEAKAASGLNHPNITTIYEIDEAEGRCFIAMEFVGGRSLRELVKRGSLSQDEVVDITLQVAMGLNAAHKNGVIHRDIKPDNIMVSEDGVVKIMDFGLAKLKGATRLTREGSTLGTLRYMAPEQVSGHDVDARSDLFSFGVVLYEMITGRPPFGGDDEAAVIHSILNVAPEPLARYKADVPEGLQRIVDKALAKDMEERYQHADEAVADLKRERHISDRIDTTTAKWAPTPPGSRSRRFRLAGILGVIAVVIILYLVFQPFRIEMGPDRAAIAQNNSLAVMYFENMVDPADADMTGQMVTALLITDLSESQYMRVLSRQRLYDILTRLGTEDRKVIDKSVASQVAKEAGAKWILTGTVLQVEPRIVLASEISEAETGEILASQRVDGEEGEDLFGVIDRLTVEIREDMALPDEAKTEEDRPIADVTTHSQEAYRYYLEGLELLDKYYRSDAEVSFRKAVELDSTFAMALYNLAAVTVGKERKNLLERALRHSANASQVERYYVEAFEAFDREDYEETIRRLQRIIDIEPDHKDTHLTMGIVYSQFLGEQEPGIYHLKRAVEIDPLCKSAYNIMAYAYETLGDQDSSLWAINNYIALAPDEANPYDTRGDLYAYSGRLDRAMESYRKADEMRPGFSTLKIGHMHLFEGRYAEAESCYNVVAASANKWDRSEARTYLAIIPIYQGKFEEGLEMLDRAIGADEMEQTLRRWSADKHRLATNIYLELRDYDEAVKRARGTRDVLLKAYPENPAFVFDFYVHALAHAGRIEEAEEAVDVLESTMDEDALSHSDTYLTIKANMARAKGDLDAAIGYYEEALKAAPDYYFHIRSMLGEAYLEAGRLDQAVGILEQAISRYDAARVLVPSRAVTAYYSLGQAYERSGWKDKAIEQYEIFLDIWKDADPGIPEVEDARQRLARLKRGG